LRKVLIMVENDFEDPEFIYPYYRFQEEGYQVDIVGPKAKENYVGKHGYPVVSDLSPSDINIDEYDAVIIPGGWAPDRMRRDEKMVKIVKDAFEKGKVIAAICHGPEMLIEADILKGKKATCFKAIVTDLKNAGAVFVDEPVVVDGNIVTSRFPGDLPYFCREAIKLLKSKTSE